MLLCEKQTMSSSLTIMSTWHHYVIASCLTWIIAFASLFPPRSWFSPLQQNDPVQHLGDHTNSLLKALQWFPIRMLKTAERPKPHLSSFIFYSFPGCSLYFCYIGLLGVLKTHQHYPGNFVPAVSFACIALPRICTCITPSSPSSQL